MLDPAASAAAHLQFMEACSKLANEDSNLTADTRYYITRLFCCLLEILLKLLCSLLRCQLSLPTVKGSSKNHDLKNIDCHTLANVLEGRYKSKIGNLRIIDARYTYEYTGGHIRYFKLYLTDCLRYFKRLRL